MNSFGKQLKTIFADGFPSIKFFHHCLQTGVPSSNREHGTFTPVCSLHRLHLSAQRRVYLGCDRVWHLLAVNVRDAGDVTQLQLAAEPKPRRNWDSAGYLDICIEVADNCSEDASRMVWFDSQVKAGSHFILALIMSNPWNAFSLLGPFADKKTHHFDLNDNDFVCKVRVSANLECLVRGGTLSSVPLEFQSREKLIQHRFPNLTCDHINNRKCVKQRAEPHSH